ncbi:MAG: cytochrome c3 family protein [Deltaproteobacteria bacterium]|nr:cytochrome c3 family protein [Deltaproteobacteria bacterium]
MKVTTILSGAAFFIWTFALPQPGQTSNVIHFTHFVGIKGDLGLLCMDCHKPTYHEDGAVELLLDRSTCEKCHSPDGAFDGMDDPDIGAWNPINWPTSTGESKIFDTDGHLRPGKEKWCLGCHDDGTSAVHGVAAPNIAGKSMSGDWQSPAAIAGSGFSGAANLIDSDLATGSTDSWGQELLFDLGGGTDVSHIRFYTDLDSEFYWQVYGSNDLTNWTQILYGRSIIFAAPAWGIEAGEGWIEARLDIFGPFQYLKVVKVSPYPLPLNALREFQFKKNLQYGYLTTGHKISCDNCHDTASIHIDGVAQSYKSSLNNYTGGYRLADVASGSQAVPALEIPRTGCNSGENPRTGNDFALCFSCHDKYSILGDAYGAGDFQRDPPQTLFRNDDHLDSQGHVSNEHLRHLRGRGYCGNNKDWDSDWDGTADSPQSCTACHNVHGSPNPAMTRHGELAGPTGSTDKVPMINLQYINADGDIDPDLGNAGESSGAQLQFLGAGAGTVAKNKTCNMCHNDQMTYYRTP